MIPVTKPFFPPQEEYQAMLAGIWERQWLTNQGQYAQELEAKLIEKLGIPNLCWVSNGTVALQMAIRALGLKGKIITTPFSYVATTSSIVWEHCEPVFADIDSRTFNLNPKKVERLVAPDTVGILATHVFGVPCDVEALQELADQYNIPIIYDAAHTFAVKYKGQSIFNYGDISTTSFHATKLFHTGEGGGLIAKNDALAEKLYYMRNFGHWGPERFHGLGTNAKNSELHAAMGLCNLNYIDELIARRKDQSMLYDQLLADWQLQRPYINEDVEYNYIYHPILLSNEHELLQVVNALHREDIQPRRYFFPLLSTLPYVSPLETPIAADIAKRILCLPLYHTLADEDIAKVCGIIDHTLKSS